MLDTDVLPPQDAHALRSYLSLHAAILVLGFAAVVAVGYGGVERHDVLEWVNMGGWGQWLIVLWYPFAAFALASLARRRAQTGEASSAGFWIALAPALQGAFTTYTGWRTILKAMPQAAVLDQLAIFSAARTRPTRRASWASPWAPSSSSRWRRCPACRG